MPPEGQVDGDDEGLPDEQDEDDCPAPADVLRKPQESLPE